MIRWIPYTFIRIAIFFISGILLGIYYPMAIGQNIATILLITLLVAYLIAYVVFRFLNKPLFNLGCIGLPAVFLAGYVHLLIQTDSRNPDHLIKITEPVQYYRAIVTKYAEEKERSWKTEAKVTEVFTDTWQHSSGKVVLYLSKDAFEAPFQYGDVLLIKGHPVPVEPPSNPGEFDYKRFLTFRNIYHQHFLKGEDVKTLGNDPPSEIMSLAIRARVWADRTLKQFVQGEREQAIATALVLGVTDGLDNELLNAYAATGAMHVLAVSGLHISIIYMILLWLLKPLQKVRAGPWILAVLSLVVLWAYAFVTGLSPSVLRAVTMFSFIAVARPARQSTNIYNTLAASAFCLLLFDPYLIMSVGFQLSYLAVLGIVYLTPRFYSVWEAQSYLADQVWKITCVSIAAQVATFSLGLLYFHQFPNYFLLSNLLVIPGSFMILVLGIVVLATSFISSLASVLGFLLTWTIKALNYVVFTVEAFPFSLVENIYITVFQCWLLMALIVAFVLLQEYKHFNYTIAAFVIAVLFTGFQWQHFSEKINIRKITIYNVNGHSAIDLIDCGQTYFLTDSVLLHDRERLRFHVRPNRLESGVGVIHTDEPLPFVKEFQGGKVIAWKDRVIVHVLEKDFLLPEKIRPDWIVIGNNAVYDISVINGLATQAKKIILDSSNSYFYTERILNESSALNLDIYSVRHRGAFDVMIPEADS